MQNIDNYSHCQNVNRPKLTWSLPLCGGRNFTGDLTLWKNSIFLILLFLRSYLGHLVSLAILCASSFSPVNLFRSLSTTWCFFLLFLISSTSLCQSCCLAFPRFIHCKCCHHHYVSLNSSSHQDKKDFMVPIFGSHPASFCSNRFDRINVLHFGHKHWKIYHCGASFLQGDHFINFDISHYCLFSDLSRLVFICLHHSSFRVLFSLQHSKVLWTVNRTEDYTSW